MFHVAQIITIVMIGIAMVPAIAHLLEFPGKMRLDREEYLAVQPIYHPVFTYLGGIAEVAGMLGSIILIFLTPRGTHAFWFTWVSAAAMIAMEAVYWIYVQPVNKFWLAKTSLGKFGQSLFALKAGGTGSVNPVEDWRILRDRWEYGHIVRAALVFLSFLSLLSPTIEPVPCRTFKSSE